MRASLLVLCCVLAGCAAERHRDGPPGRAGRHSAGPGDTGGRGGRGPLFASPLGEPFHGPDGESRWFSGADADGDGALTSSELDADALRFFATLDQGKDGEIDPDDLERYETVLFPEIRVAGANGGGGPRAGRGRGGRGGGRGGMRGGSRMGGGGMKGGGGDRGTDQAGGRDMANTAGRQGAGRFSYLAIPEPVSSADANFNRGVSAQELVAAARTRFSLLDTNHDGRLTLAELPSITRGRRSPGGSGRAVD